MEFRRLSISDAEAIAKWRYTGEYAIYNVADTAMESSVRYFSDPDNRFFGVYEAEELMGFCSIGTDGRVPGGVYDEFAVDIGAGMRPDLLGKRGGRVFLQAAVDFVESEIGTRNLRATIASWNTRALNAVRGIGFVPQSTFIGSNGKQFTILVRAGDTTRPSPSKPTLQTDR